MWFKPTSTLQIYREIATVREAKRSNLYMTVIEYHRKYFHHIINVTLIEKKGIVILCCHSESYQYHTRGIIQSHQENYNKRQFDYIAHFLMVWTGSSRRQGRSKKKRKRDSVNVISHLSDSVC